MRKKYTPCVVWQIVWLLPFWLVGLAGCTTNDGSTYSGQMPPASADLAGRAIVDIESNPSGAMITVNGRPYGPAPISLRIVLDTLGDAGDSYSVSADFSSAIGGGSGRATGTVTHQIAPGDRPPTRISFDPDGAMAN